MDGGLMAILLVGIFVGAFSLLIAFKAGAAIGFNKSVKRILCVAALSIGGAIIMCFAEIPGAVVTSAGLVLFLVEIIGAICERVKMYKKAVENQKIEFYNECIADGITKCETEKEIQKATLVAQKHKIGFTDIAELFKEAEALKNKDAVDEKNSELDNKKKEESARYNELNKYSEFRGRDKRLAMLKDERARALGQAKSLRSDASAFISATQQQEMNWGVHAGVASAIAGPAAGVAAAADIQMKNAAIRAQNEANMKTFAPVMRSTYRSVDAAEKRAKELLGEIEDAKTKLVSDDDAKTCLKKLDFSDTKIEVSETGTCTVTTRASLKRPLVIFGDTAAVLDGFVIAKIYDGKTIVGTASMPLPVYGIQSQNTLKGMCLYCGEPGKAYRAEFAAINLWAMEK